MSERRGRPELEERYAALLTAALDGELTEDEREELESALRGDPALRAEWERLRRVKEVTGMMEFDEPPAETWDRYWTGVYRRIERGIGWVLASLGAVVLLSWGAWSWIQELLADRGLPTLVKGAVLLLVVGVVILFVSVVREKMHLRRDDPYKDVQR